LSGYPLFGVGLNNLQYYGYFGGVKGLFSVVAQVGIVGTGALLAFTLVLIRKIVKVRKSVFRKGSKLDYDLATLGVLFVILPMIASFGTGRYSFRSMFFWLDYSLAALIYFNLKRQYSASSRGQERLSRNVSQS
jgi:hypothetical protein